MMADEENRRIEQDNRIIDEEPAAAITHGEDKFNDAAVIHTFLHDARIGLWVLDIEPGQTPHMHADESMQSLLGIPASLSPEECYTFWCEHIDPVDLELAGTVIKRMYAGEFMELVYQYHHPTAGTLLIRGGGARDPKETRFVSINGYHQNITSLQTQTRQSLAIRTNNDELLYSLSNVFSSLYRIDPVTKNVVTMRSPDDVLLEGERSYDEFMEQCLARLHPDDRLAFSQEFSASHLDGLGRAGVSRFEREYRRLRDGEYRWTAFTVYYCQLRDGRRWGILGSWDVHERRSREEQQKRVIEDACQAAEVSANARQEFLSHMSHDLRTPINQILGMAAVAEARQDDPEQVRVCLHRITEAGDRLRHLVNEILDVSRIQSGQLVLEKEPFTIESLIANSIYMVHNDAADKEITLRTEIQVRHHRVHGDHFRLGEMMWQFLMNAIQYTPAGGTITLSVTELPRTTGQYVGYQFDCKDTGIGIPEEHLQHVFDPFWREADSRTTQNAGAGLGLAVTRNLATLMGGWVSAQSTRDEGSCFTAVVYLEILSDECDEPDGVQGVEIHEHGKESLQQDGSQAGSGSAIPDPRRSNACRAREIFKETDDISLEGIRVLVVEDNEINREIAEELLQAEGALTEGVENGAEAVAAYTDHGDRYDIILMDIKMPVMDGNEATRRIRELERDTGHHVPIIALTANSYAEDIATSLAAGIDRHITKPYDAPVLHRTIRELLTWGDYIC